VPARCWEGNEEGVALRIDLDTTVGGEHPPQDLAVLAVDGCAELAQQLRRPCTSVKRKTFRRSKVVLRRASRPPQHR